MQNEKKNESSGIKNSFSTKSAVTIVVNGDVDKAGIHIEAEA